ncbi:hypothetical protein JW998_09825 [candidate division KSB1 bacterium]|nr:hypothetical protein [candidate division KSB1 bacterium]
MSSCKSGYPAHVRQPVRDQLPLGSIINGIFRHTTQLYVYLFRTRHAEAYDPACGEHD